MGNSFGGCVLGCFFPVLNAVAVAIEMQSIFPVPTGYLIPLIAHKPFKQKTVVKSIVVLRGHVQRALGCTGLCSQSN